MDDGYQEMILVHFSGAMTEVKAYTGLAAQTIGILVGGLILWRLSNLMHKRKKNQRRQTNYFETPYSKGWKRT